MLGSTLWEIVPLETCNIYENLHISWKLRPWVVDHKSLLSDIEYAWKYESDAGWMGYENIIITCNVAMVILFLKYMS